MVNKNILKVRKELDKLDNILLEIIKKRTKLVDKVIQNKKFKKEIVDKKRITIILKNISKYISRCLKYFYRFNNTCLQYGLNLFQCVFQSAFNKLFEPS